MHRFIAAALAFWLAVFALQKLNWFGAYQASLLGAVLLSIPVLLALLRRRPRIGTGGGLAPRATITLAALLGAVIIAQLVYFALRVAHPHVLDIATTTLDAGAAIMRGENPYALPLDAVAGGLGDAAFHGYKYMPVMALAYLPLGLPFGERGVLATNLLLHAAVAWMVWRLAWRAGTIASAQIAALLYLSLPIVAMQVLAKGSTDLVAVAPLLLALLCVERSPLAAGICVGLSICAKLLPGLVFVPAVLPGGRAERLRYALGIAIGLAPAVPFVLWSPTAFADNIVMFALLRPPDATSWAASLPGYVVALARGVGAAVVLGIAVDAWLRPPSLLRRCGLGAILALVAILAGGSAHHNYQLWWLPFYAVLLAVAVRPTSARTAPEAIVSIEGAAVAQRSPH